MKNILVICDDVWHPAEVIEKGFSYLENEEFHFEFVKAAKDILTPEMIAEYPMIICCKGNSINAANREPWFEATVTEVGPREIKEYVENGGIYVVLHAASAVHPNWVNQDPRFVEPAKEYVDFLGCTFHGHPLRCPVTVHNVNESHPIMQGVRDFTERDEHYQLKITADNATLLFTTSSEPGGSDVPGGFLFPVGQGEVIVVSPGHTLAVWKNPQFQKMMQNLLVYGTNR